MATKRGYYREELLRAVDNLEMALTHLARVVEAYEKAHPEIAQPVLEVGNAIAEIGDIIKAIHAKI